jgi:hypothetical protein
MMLSFVAMKTLLGYMALHETTLTVLACPFEHAGVLSLLAGQHISNLTGSLGLLQIREHAVQASSTHHLARASATAQLESPQPQPPQCPVGWSGWGSWGLGSPYYRVLMVCTKASVFATGASTGVAPCCRMSQS